jgi:hypothetical protein
MTTPRLPQLQHTLLLALYQGDTDPRYRKPYADLVKGGFAGEAPGHRYRWYVTQKGAAYVHAHRTHNEGETQ